MTPAALDPVLPPEQLWADWANPRWRIIDCRFSLADPAWGPAAYRAGHLPGAVYLGLEADLSGAVGPHGGRHPLPDPAKLARRLGELGVSREHTVVVYDELGEMSARAWWLLTYLDFPHVYVLDGGFPAWEAMAGPVTPEVPQHVPVAVEPRVRPEMLVRNRRDVEAAARAGALIDSRAGSRYRGDTEPLDRRPGHIPGAINLAWERVKDGATGRFRSPRALGQRFAGLPPEVPPVVYCGSGVTACPNILALWRIGRPAKLYAGSWSDWVSYPDRPVAVGPEHPDPEDIG